MRYRLANGLLALPTAVQRRIVGAPVVLDGQQLDLESQLWLKLIALDDAPDRRTMPLSEVRARVTEEDGTTRGATLGGALARELTVDGAAGPLEARLYVPDPPDAHLANGTGDGLLVFYHGGGFVLCDLDTHDNPCRLLARQSGVRVLSVAYRLAPEDPFPAAFDDAVAAFRFAVEHAAELGADPSRVAVGGDSAGGNLAAGVAQAAAGDGGPAPALQLLVYPWLDLAGNHRSRELFGEGFDLGDEDLEWLTGLYVPGSEDVRDPRCSPLLAAEMSGLAPAYVITAGFDPLRDEGEEYAQRLADAGVTVTLRRHPGLIHGFMNLMGIGRTGREAIVEMAGAVRLGLAPA
jgi:acetyl esterase